MKYVEANIIVLEDSNPIGSICFSYDTENNKFQGMKYYGNNDDIKRYNMFEILKLAIVQNEYLNARELTAFDNDIYFDVKDMDTIKNIMENGYSDLFAKRK